jgi:3-oxoacyl-[acyl-carrier protein] reductase
MISLAGKAALVTGGNRGIGRAVALMLARSGADVGITCRSRQREAEDVVAEIRALGRRAFAAAGDLADELTAERVTTQCVAELGRLDLFVGNHGIWPVEEIALRDMDMGRWRSTMAANLDSIFTATRAALKRMETGSVVLVSSTAGQRGEAFHADYAATKGAMISLVKSLAVECAPRITVNAVAPGWVLTEMSESALSGGGDARIAATIPLRRIASAEDIAGPIVFLCSDLARHITGEILNVNGGSVLCG